MHSRKTKDQRALVGCRCHEGEGCKASGSLFKFMLLCSVQMP